VASRENRISRKEGETQSKKSLCGFTTLRLCVNKKRRPFKASYPAVGGFSGFARKKNISQRRADAKKEIPLRLYYFAPLREQKKKTFQIKLPCRRQD
jgi:4'-phosphopantetheinyl transferase EntD